MTDNEHGITMLKKERKKKKKKEKKGKQLMILPNIFRYD